VRNIIKWAKSYYSHSDRMIGMTFFNEVKIPPDNRQAVYDTI